MRCMATDHNNPTSPTSESSRPRSGLARTYELLRSKLWRADLYGLRGVPAQYHAGMKAFWFDSLLASTSDALYANYISLYILALGGTRNQVGLFTSLASLLGMVGPIPGAALTRRWGQRKRMVVVFSVLFRLMLLLAALVPLFVTGPAAVAVLIAVFALRVGFINLFAPAWISLTRDIVPMAHRGHYFSSRNVMMALVSMLVVPLAGQLIEWGGEPGGYQFTLAIAFAVGLGASYVFSRIPEARQRQPATGGLGTQLRSFWHALTANRIFLGFVLIRILYDLAVQIGGPYFSVYQVEVLNSPASTIGLLTTLTAFTRMIGLRVWGRLLDRRGARWVTTLAALLIPVLPFIWWFASEPWHIAFVSVPSGFLWAGFEIGAFALLLELLEGEDSTQAAAGYTTLVAAASIAGPLIGAWVIDRVGYLWDFSLSGVLRLIGGMLFLLLLKPFGSRNAKNQSEPEPSLALTAD